MRWVHLKFSAMGLTVGERDGDHALDGDPKWRQASVPLARRPGNRR
jgi:hypothetical protein